MTCVLLCRRNQEAGSSERHQCNSFAFLRFLLITTNRIHHGKVIIICSSRIHHGEIIIIYSAAYPWSAHGHPRDTEGVLVSTHYIVVDVFFSAGDTRVDNERGGSSRCWTRPDKPVCELSGDEVERHQIECRAAGSHPE